MTTMSIQLPESLHNGIENIAQQEGVSIDQFIISAITEKISTLLSGQSWLKYVSLDTQSDKAEQINSSSISLKEISVFSGTDVLSQYKWADKIILKHHMKKLLATLPTQCEPIGAELLQQEMRKANLAPNELSRSIIQAREE